MSQTQKFTPEKYSELFSKISRIEDALFRIETLTALLEVTIDYANTERKYLDEVKTNFYVATYLEEAHKSDLLFDEAIGDIHAVKSILEKAVPDAYQILFSIKPEITEDNAG